jgi:hypothetical protein
MREQYDLDGQPRKPSRIEPVKGHKPPKELRKTQKHTFEPVVDPKVLKAEIDARMDELTKDVKQPKQTLKERAMGALLNQLLAFFKTWLYGRPVYKTKVSAVTGEVEFVLDDKGKKVMNVPLTVLGRVMQLLGAMGLLTSALWGKSIAEWGAVLEKVLRLF